MKHKPLNIFGESLISHDGKFISPSTWISLHFPKSRVDYPHSALPWLRRCCHFEWTTATGRWTEYPPRFTVLDVENTKICKRNIWRYSEFKDFDISDFISAFQLRMWVVRFFVIAESTMNICWECEAGKAATCSNKAIATKARRASRLANCRGWSSSLEFEYWNFVFSKLDYIILQSPEAEETLNLLGRVGSQVTT